MSDPQSIAERYVALWNETDPIRRRMLIEVFFFPHAEHYVKAREAKGYDALFDRVTRSHEKNVRENGCRFRAEPDAQLVRNIVTFHWDMTPAGDPNAVSAVGLEVIEVDDHGRAWRDYMFIVA